MLGALILLAAAVQGPGDVETLARAADAVVHAHVVKTSAAYGSGGGLIFTTATLRVDETWKGAPAAEIRVLTPGGAVGALDQVVQGVAQFREGEEVVLFLHQRAPGVFQTERLALGKFTVGAALPSLPSRAIRDRRGLECQGCGFAETDDLSLDELRARVLGSLAK